MNKKILIADDDPAILDALKEILEYEGYEVETTIDGDTVPLMQGKLPNLVLLDIWMSRADGRKICKKLKTQDNTKQIPIIMMSANKETERFAKEAGADNFLTKPFDIDMLVSLVEKHIGTSSS